MASVNSAIKIYCRIKPTPEPLVPYDIMTLESGEEMIQLSLKDEHPATIAQLYLNNKPEQYKFRFTKAFDRSTRQDYVFQEVARPVIDSALQGYNGTIFAYGQTGTGKTFTMTGARASFNERGIIPRTLEYIFQKFEGDVNPNKVRNVFVSYLEIYNEVGYDLLNPSSMTGRMDDLGRVSLMEDGNQQMHLRNLSVHSIETVEDATQFLYLGDHNRTIAETPLNEVSTRSHCIFTIHLNIRDVNTSLTTRSKLHLVDLAGSERVSTISTTSQLATEARHINLALHYLEQVIVALGDSNRSHIPYRNSMMTSVLRDSLGGNCMTSMIATISLDTRNTQETLSTCRFSQRVAMVTNAVQRNEDLDPNIIINQLKSEVKKLRAIIESNSMKPTKENTSPLTEDELAVCSYGVQQFLAECDNKLGLPIPADMRMVQECFRILKLHVISKPTSYDSSFNPNAVPASGKAGNTSGNSIGGTGQILMSAAERNFQQLLAQRDAEIKVLMDMLRKQKIKSRTHTATSVSDRISAESISPTPVNVDVLRQSTRDGSEGDDEQGMLVAGEDLLVPMNPFDGTCPTNIQLPIEAPEGSPRTPPPTRADTGLDAHTVMRNFSQAKREALIGFISKYDGTSALEAERTKLFQSRGEIQNLEQSISSCIQNIESMRKIAESTGDCSTVSGIMSDQQRVLDEFENRLVSIREDTTLLEEKLKRKYTNVLSEFDRWWDMCQKTDGETERYNTDGIPLTVIDTEFPSEQPVGTVFKTSKEEEGQMEGITSQVPPSTPKSSQRQKASGTGEKLPRTKMKAKVKLGNSSFNPISQISPRVKKNEGGRHDSQEMREFKSPLITNGFTNSTQGFETSDDEISDTERLNKGGIPSTGDKETDQEVLQFLQNRKQVFESIRRQKQSKEPKPVI